MNRMVLIDTNVYAGFKTGDEKAVEEIRNAETIGMNSVLLAELYAGFRLGSREKKNLAELEAFRESARVKTFDVTERTAFFYSHVLAGLRRKGHPIPTNDIWMAASAMEHGMVLLSFDEHFHFIDGLAWRML